MTDFAQLITVFRAMNLHGQFWAMMQKFPAEELEHMTVGGFEDYLSIFDNTIEVGLSHNIHFKVDPVDGEAGLNWTIELSLKPYEAEISCRLGADYNSDPYQVCLVEICRAKANHFDEFASLLDQASKKLVGEMEYALREKTCLKLWEDGKACPELRYSLSQTLDP